MANNENLKPFDQRTESEQREIRSKGGKASGEARRKKANLKKAMEQILTSEFEVNGKTYTGQEMLTLNMFQIATSKKHKQAVQAYKAIMQTVGNEDEALSNDLERAEELLGGITDVIE